MRTAKVPSSTYSFVIVGAVSILAACSHKHGGGSGANTSVQLLSPSAPNAAMNSSRPSLEFAAANFTSLTAVVAASGTTLSGVTNDKSIFVYEVPLLPGANEIRVTGNRADGTSAELVLSLTRSPDTYQVATSAAPQFSEQVPSEVVLGVSVATPQAPVELLVDQDGDGVLEQRGGFAAEAKVAYAQTGVYRPRIIVRTTDNQLLSMDPERSPLVRVLEPTVPDPKLAYAGAGADPSDLDYDAANDLVFVLAAGDRVVRVFGRVRTVVRTISLTSLTAPSGIALDGDGHLYVADKGGHQVLKLLAPSYVPDTVVGPNGTFGRQGTGNGQFNGPLDVAVEGRGDAASIFVADTGNHRIQRFNRVGIFEASYDGTLRGGQPFVSPRGIVTLPAGGFAVLEPSEVRLIASDGGVVTLFGGFREATKLTRDWHAGGLTVVDSTGISICSLGGIVLRRPTFAGVGPFEAALVIPGPVGALLIGAVRGARDLVAAVLGQDPTSAAPLQIVRLFLDAMAKGDAIAARDLVSARALTVFDAAVSDPTQLARIKTESSTVANLHLVSQANDSALVIGTRTQGSATSPVEFVLGRLLETGLWRLTNF